MYSCVLMQMYVAYIYESAVGVHWSGFDTVACHQFSLTDVIHMPCRFAETRHDTAQGVGRLIKASCLVDVTGAGSRFVPHDTINKLRFT